jgi:hypothetical protein
MIGVLSDASRANGTKALSFPFSKKLLKINK